MKKQTITIEHTLGDIVATKDGQDEAWAIAAPWTDTRFYGSVPECKAVIRKIIKVHEDVELEAPLN